jgi:hypothetical protein
MGIARVERPGNNSGIGGHSASKTRVNALMLHPSLYEHNLV